MDMIQTNRVNRINRQTFLDALRIMATCAVVLMHTLTGNVDVTDMSAFPRQRMVFLVLMDLITWCVPVFLLISGYLFLDPDRSFSYPIMLKKYCLRVVLALFLFGIPYACLEQIMAEGSFRIAMAGKAVWMVLTGNTWSHMWYLYLILVLYLLTPLFKKLLKELPLWCVYGIQALLFLGSSIAPFINKLFNISSVPVLPDGGIYLFYYLCGYLFVRSWREKQKELVEEEKCFAKLPCGLVIGMTIVWAAGMAVSRIVFDFSVQMAYNYPLTVILSLLLFWDARYLERVLPAKWLKKGSALCFTVYLVHPVFSNILYKLLKLSLLDYPLSWGIPAFFLAMLIPSVGVAWLLRKVPLLRKYIL